MFSGSSAGQRELSGKQTCRTAASARAAHATQRTWVWSRYVPLVVGWGGLRQTRYEKDLEVYLSNMMVTT